MDDRLDRQYRQGHILTGLGKYIRRFLAQGYTVTKNLWVSKASRQIQDDKVVAPSLRININVIKRIGSYELIYPPPPATVRAFNLILAPYFSIRREK